MCSHYIVLSAFKGSCQDIKEELFFQHSGKYFYLPLYSANVTRRLRCLNDFDGQSNMKNPSRAKSAKHANRDLYGRYVNHV